MSPHSPYAEWDLLASNLLPNNWTAQIQATLESDGIHTVLSGESTESREPSANYEVPVMVVTGERCARNLPWLRRLYEIELRQFASKEFGKQLYIAKDERSSININCLRSIGARYEAHVDTNTVTGVLFACDTNRDTGGELVFVREGRPTAVVWPRPGVFIAFDGRDIAHYVGALKVNMDRISLPMNYYDDPVCQYRPPGLDERLYTPR